MKLLVVDTLIEVGHKNFNVFFIRELSKRINLDIMSFESYYSDLGISEIISLPESLKIYRSKLEFRLKQLIIIEKIKKQTKRGGYDGVLFLSFENTSFSLAWPSCIKTYAFMHNNLDRIDRFWIERFLFRLKRRSTVFIVFDSVMADYMESLGLVNAVIPHPNYLEKINYTPRRMESGLIFAPSGSSSGDVIMEWITFVQRCSGFRLVAKGNYYLDTPKVTVQPRFDNYLELLSAAEYVLLPVDFKFRTSGVFHEAMFLGKKIIATRCPMMLLLKSYYPNSINIIETPSDLLKCVFDISQMNEEHDSYKKRHCRDFVIGQVERLFN